MPGKVFISCGQNFKKERKVAKKIRKWFLKNGYDPYVAISAQTIQDVNSGIIGQLKTSDYYVFVDFPREELPSNGKKRRGSLFTNQELAIAYLLDFEKVIFLQHCDVKLEGLLQYMASNAIKFDDYSTVHEIVAKNVKEYSWSPAYSRHLIPEKLRLSDEIIPYRPSLGLNGRFLYIDIKNNRSDIVADSTVARLNTIKYPSGETKLSSDGSYLKATGFPGYQHSIWPSSHAAFDLLCVNVDHPERIFLNSSSEQHKPPIFEGRGEYLLNYEVISPSFPLLKFSILLTVTGDIDTVTAVLQ